MNKKDQTTHTYNAAADQMVLKFDKIGHRSNDIAETFSLIQKENPKVIEIGCGSGRDAEYIIKHTDDYIGLDISKRFIEIAQEKNPTKKFEVTDIEEYIFPNNIDVVFAFASLLHTPKDSLKNIFHNIFLSMNDGGVVRVSLKHKDTYTELTNYDEFGVRTYYYYSLGDIKEMNTEFKIIKSEVEEKIGQSWLELILQK